MTNAAIINELLEIEAWAKGLMERCHNTRKKLERIDAPAPRKGKPKGATEEQIARVLARRNKHILKTCTIIKKP